MENNTKLEPNYDRRTNLCSIMRSNTIKIMRSNTIKIIKKKRTLFQNYEREYREYSVFLFTLFFLFIFSI